MTTTTPEQVAREVLEKHASIHAGRLSGENALTIATAAIKADRAQRHARHVDKLADWIAHPRTATSYACAAALREILNESR